MPIDHDWTPLRKQAIAARFNLRAQEKAARAASYVQTKDHLQQYERYAFGGAERTSLLSDSDSDADYSDEEPLPRPRSQPGATPPAPNYSPLAPRRQSMLQRSNWMDSSVYGGRGRGVDVSLFSEDSADRESAVRRMWAEYHERFVPSTTARKLGQEQVVRTLFSEYAGAVGGSDPMLAPSPIRTRPPPPARRHTIEGEVVVRVMDRMDEAEQRMSTSARGPRRSSVDAAAAHHRRRPSGGMDATQRPRRVPSEGEAGEASSPVRRRSLGRKLWPKPVSEEALEQIDDSEWQ